MKTHFVTGLEKANEAVLISSPQGVGTGKFRYSGRNPKMAFLSECVLSRNYTMCSYKNHFKMSCHK